MHMQMGRDLWLFLAIASLLTTGLAGGGEYWNILKYQNKKHMQQSAVLGDNNLKKYCESWRMNVEVNNIRGFDVVPQECIDHIGKYMTSSQYKSDSERTMEESSLYLSSHFCNFKGDGKDAWIFDIDDTLLSTLPYFKKHQFGGEKLNETCLEGWMRETKAPALEHTLQLYHEIRGKGIKIFLISSRREPLRDATVDNLIKVGYHGWTSLVLRDLWLFLAIASLLTTGLAGGGEYWNILKNQNKKHMQQSAVLGDNNLKKYCESWRMNVEVNNIRGFDVVPQECIDHIGKYMTSSQYKSDSERAMEESSLYLSSHFCNFKGDGKDAWIFDVDDTLLSTLPYFKKHQFGGEKLNETCLEGWMRETKAPALEHTLQLYHEIRGKGIKIFLISSRREPLRDATVDNLIKVGYHGWTSLVLRGLEDEYKEVQSYKAEARKRLVEEGYRIWGIIGDQWSSSDGLPAAKRTFKLPNPLYYVS